MSSSTATTAQAGWYAVGGGYERYWDGVAWTERLRPVPSYVGSEQRDAPFFAGFQAPHDITPN